MKYILTVVSAAAIGAFVGSLASSISPHVQAATSGRVETKEIMLLDERGRPAARLGYADGRVALSFYHEDRSLGLEVGLDRKDQSSFVRFYGKEQKIRASLISLPSGDTTFAIGDERWGPRIVMGALGTDIGAERPSSSWGLVFPKPGSSKAIFHAVVNLSQESGRSTATLGLLREDGEPWSVP